MQKRIASRVRSAGVGLREQDKQGTESRLRRAPKKEKWTEKRIVSQSRNGFACGTQPQKAKRGVLSMANNQAEKHAREQYCLTAA